MSEAIGFHRPTGQQQTHNNAKNQLFLPGQTNHKRTLTEQRRDSKAAGINCNGSLDPCRGTDGHLSSSGMQGALGVPVPPEKDTYPQGPSKIQVPARVHALTGQWKSARGSGEEA